MSLELSIVIPAFNESDRIPQTLLDIQKFVNEQKLTCEVIVVDDGSSDHTPDKLKIIQESFPELELIRYTPNRGKGYAVRSGMLASKGEYVLFMDADNSTRINEYLNLKPLLDKYDLVIASRYLPESSVVKEKKFHRTLISRFSNILIRSFLHIEFKDTQCGFKIFKREHIQAIFTQQTIDRFGFDMEIIVIAKQLGLKIAEAPVTWVDDPNTTVRPIRDTWRTLRELIVIRRNLRLGKYQKV